MSSIFQHGYALIIGVDANHVTRLALPTVAKDVQAVHDVLVHPERCAYAPENVTLIQGEASTRKEILTQLRRLREKVEADPQATAVIYFSGHGMMDQNTQRYYLIPYDILEMKYIRADAIEAEMFTAEISEIPAKRLLVVLDCCHAAGMDVKEIDLSSLQDDTTVTSAPFPVELAAPKDIPNKEAKPGSKDVPDLLEGEGRAVLNSSTGAQSSYVRRDGAMSLFTYHLIEALTGHAPHPDDATVVYVTDVMSWVTHQVKKSAKQEGVEQTPVMQTSGVFPIAQLIGGKGVALSKGEVAPDPLAFAALSQQASTEQGHAVNIGGSATIGQIGDNYTVGDVSGGNVAMGPGASVSSSADTFNMSGNFQGANVNVKSSLSSVTQTIQALPFDDESARQALTRLITQLEEMLHTVSPEQAAVAEEIAASTETLLEMATAEDAQPSVVRVLGEGLKQTARQLADHLPEIVDVVTKIVTAVASSKIG